MDNLEKYNRHVIEQGLANFETLPDSESTSTSNLIMGIIRRWYIVLLVFFLMCAVGIPVIWFSIEPFYSVTGSVRIAPHSPNPVTEADRGNIPNYSNFMNTQAEIIMNSSRIVQNVADDLADENLSFFENEPTGLVMKLKQILGKSKAKPEPASILKQAISSGVITATSDRDTELIKITMESPNAEEAKMIVDAFIKAYKTDQVASYNEEEWQKITTLEEKAKVLAEDLKNQHEQIDTLAKKYGTKSSTTLDKHQEIKLERMGMILSKITEWEARRIDLEAQVEELTKRFESSKANKKEEKSTGRQKLVTEVQLPVDQNGLSRSAYINADPTLNAFIANRTLLEQELIIESQRKQPTNPDLWEKTRAIEELNELIERRRTEVGEVYDDYMAKKLAEAEKQKMLDEKKQLTNLQVELALASTLEKRFKTMFDEVEVETHDMGLRQMEIENLKFQLTLDQEIYDTIRRRINVLDVGRSRPARISIAYSAETGPIRDKRIKYIMALMFGSMACGMMLAFLKDKADLRLRTPDDVVERIGIRIIGTTTSSETVKRPFLSKQLTGDYQTIRANLRLLNGDKEPKMLVIASPGMREGKTTFAVNLATSMSRSGKKVLLIDGDLRKPDIAYILDLPKGSRGLQDVLFGRKKYEQVVCSISATGLDVLAADSRNRDDACELLALPGVRQRINKISEKYDHVIIDTPPVLAFPDALLWAKMTDGVILTSFASQTTAPDLREAIEKFTQIKVKVLGTVLSNVRARHVYYRYGHNYYAQNVRSRKNPKRANTQLLLPIKTKK